VTHNSRSEGDRRARHHWQTEAELAVTLIGTSEAMLAPKSAARSPHLALTAPVDASACKGDRRHHAGSIQPDEAWRFPTGAAG
jgi:hypothetical protein